MTEDEWQRLYEGFETTDLLTAVGQLDAVRRIVGDGENWEPPEIRTDLLKLHQLAMDVVNHGVTDKAQEMFELADDIDSQVFDMMGIFVQPPEWGYSTNSGVTCPTLKGEGQP